MTAARRPFEVLRRCPGCNSEAITLALLPNLWRCSCGLYFETPRPRAEAIRALYDTGITYRRFGGEWGVRERLWRRRLRLVLSVARGGRLLDVGTGDGHFLTHARRHFTVEGTEISQAGVALARSRGLSMHLGPLSELPLAEGSFDVVTLWHVLEHVPYAGETLACVRRLVKPQGHVVVAVPNEARVLDLSRWCRRQESPFWPRHYGEEVHLIHLTPGSLRALLERNGLRVRRLLADDVDVERSLASRGRETAYRLLGAVLARRWSTAMVAICQSV